MSYVRMDIFFLKIYFFHIIFSFLKNISEKMYTNSKQPLCFVIGYYFLFFWSWRRKPAVRVGNETDWQIICWGNSMNVIRFAPRVIFIFHQIVTRHRSRLHVCIRKWRRNRKFVTGKRRKTTGKEIYN